MNELQIFNFNNLEELKEFDKKERENYLGYFYIVEYGNYIKIGKTNQPYKRIQALKRAGVNYGNVKLGSIALSISHTNFSKNEKLLHKYFKNHRKVNTELFDISFSEAVNCINNLSIEYLDETEELKKKADVFCKGMKEFMLGGAFNGH